MASSRLVICSAGARASRATRGGIVRDAIDLARVAGADDEPAAVVEGDVVGGVLLRLPDSVPCAVGVNAVYGAARGSRSGGLWCRARRRGRRRGGSAADGSHGRGGRHARDGRGSRRRRGRRGLRPGGRGAYGHGMHPAIRRRTQRANFRVRRIEDGETAAVGGDTDHLPGRAGTRQQVAGVVERQRQHVRRLGVVEELSVAAGRNAVDASLVASRHEDVAGIGHADGPDVAVLGVEDHLRGVAVQAVQRTVGRCAGEHPAIAAGGDGVDHLLGGFEDRRGFAVLGDAQHAPVVAAADPERAASAGHGPEERRGRLVQQFRARTERQPPVRIDGYVLGFPAQQLGLGRHAPEDRRRRLEQHQRREDCRASCCRGDGAPWGDEITPRHLFSTRTLSVRTPETA